MTFLDSYHYCEEEFICSNCGQKMFPQDDHGRLTCFCNLRGGIDVVNGERFHNLANSNIDSPIMPNKEENKDKK